MDNNLLWELALILMGATGGGMLGFLLGVLLMCMMSTRVTPTTRWSGCGE